MRTFTVFALGAGLALSSTACVHPKPMAPVPQQVATTVPVASHHPAVAAAPMAPSAPTLDEVSFYDLMEAYGLKTSIDLVTGRRTGRDGRNTVVVMPSRKWIQVNGKAFALEGMVRWRNGVLYLPGDSRTILAEKLRLVDVPEVAGDPEDFDGSEPYAVGARRGHHRTRPAAAHRRSRYTRPLPKHWYIKANRRWRYIVIHHSATHQGDAKSFGRVHRKKWVNGLGYDFVIGNGTTTPEGFIQVGPRWLRQNQGIDGAHAGNKRYNKYGIGICLVGEFNHERPTPRQLVALRRLCRALMSRYHITRNHVYMHRQVRKGSTDCPGKHFPFRTFVRSL